MKHITIIKKSTINRGCNTACGECQTSCQSACKTSCTVGNQSCEHNKDTKVNRKEKAE